MTVPIWEISLGSRHRAHFRTIHSHTLSGKKSRPKNIIFSWRNSIFKMWNLNKISCNSPSSYTFSRRASSAQFRIASVQKTRKSSASDQIPRKSIRKCSKPSEIRPQVLKNTLKSIHKCSKPSKFPASALNPRKFPVASAQNPPKYVRK